MSELDTVTDIECMAAWLRWGIKRGFLRPLEVHGFPGGPRPSKKSLTMSPALIEAIKDGDR